MPKRKRPKTGGIERSAPTRNVPYSRRRKRPESPPVFRKRSERQKQAGRQPTHAANAAGKGSAHSAKHAGAAANRYVPSGSAGTCSGRKARRRSALRKEPFYKTYRPRKFPPPAPRADSSARRSAAGSRPICAGTARHSDTGHRRTIRPTRVPRTRCGSYNWHSDGLCRRRNRRRTNGSRERVPRRKDVRARPPWAHQALAVHLNDRREVGLSGPALQADHTLADMLVETGPFIATQSPH